MRGNNTAFTPRQSPLQTTNMLHDLLTGRVVSLLAFGVAAVMLIRSAMLSSASIAGPSSTSLVVLNITCRLSDMVYEASPSQFYPVYAMGSHTGPVRGRFDPLYEDNTLWKKTCPLWLNEKVDGEHQFTSQFGQDTWLWHNVFRWYPTDYRGVYVDSAAFHPIKESNTYFFDRCLEWSGLCIEPQPANYARFVGRRSCAIVPFALSDRVEVAEFESFKGEWAGATGVGKMKAAEENPVFQATIGLTQPESRTTFDVFAFPMQSILDHHGITHIDYWSLDVEGYELKAVTSVNFSRTSVDFISIENSPAGTKAMQYLLALGYQPVRGDKYDAISLVDYVLVGPQFARFHCGQQLQKLDSFRMCSGDKREAEPPEAKAKYKLCAHV